MDGPRLRCEVRIQKKSTRVLARRRSASCSRCIWFTLTLCLHVTQSTTKSRETSSTHSR
jgi:hypothetical protein